MDEACLRFLCFNVNVLMLFFSAHNVPDKPKIVVVHLPESILKSIGVATRGHEGPGLLFGLGPVMGLWDLCKIVEKFGEASG